MLHGPPFLGGKRVCLEHAFCMLFASDMLLKLFLLQFILFIFYFGNLSVESNY